MNERAFQKFLATGEYVLTMDSAENPGAEFGENWKQVPIDDYPRWKVNDIVKDVQLQPDEDHRADSLSLGGLWKVNNHYVVKLYGGTNGSQDTRITLAYLAVVRKFAKKMLDDGVAEDIWLLDCKNDALDDVWRVRLAFKTKPDPKEKENAPEQ